MKHTAGTFLEQMGTVPTVPAISVVQPTTAPTVPESGEPQSEEPEPKETEPVLYPELLAAMESYNQQIWEEKQSGLCDPWAYEQPSFTYG